MLRDERRILVIGPSGAGKSTLAIRLGRVLDLPVIHLDAHFWRPGWVPTPFEEWLPVHDELMARPAWIIDGSYDRTLSRRLERADAVLFLDFPKRVYRFGIVKRIAQSYGTVRPDTAPGCPEKIDPGFFRWVWSWERDVRPGIVDALERAPAGLAIHRLTSRREVAALLRAAGERAAGAAKE